MTGMLSGFLSFFFFTCLSHSVQPCVAHAAISLQSRRIVAAEGEKFRLFFFFLFKLVRGTQFNICSRNRLNTRWLETCKLFLNFATTTIHYPKPVNSVNKQLANELRMSRCKESCETPVAFLLLTLRKLSRRHVNTYLLTCDYNNSGSSCADLV